jgi:hypothetical protein
MTDNHSLSLSLAFKRQLASNLFPTFEKLLPTEAIEQYVKDKLPHTRDKVYTPSRTALSMIFTGVQEDKSLQNTVNIFNAKYESECKILQQRESALLLASKESASKNKKKRGRPQQFCSKLPKSKTTPLSDRTVAYTKARQRLPTEFLRFIFNHTNSPFVNKEEIWHEMRTFITDGTYCQLQDTSAIREIYPPIENNGMYPQALLQVFIRQGSGQIQDYASGNRKMSELELVLPMIKKMQDKDLLLADDLYNTYCHFCFILQQKAHIIVPGKRDRNYTVEKVIAPGDEIVKINKPSKRPDYVSVHDWENLPEDILLRRISYEYPTKDGLQTSVLYTTILDEKIEKTEIVLKYTSRWDIEICIREIKTLMDINVLRAKSPDMLEKELTASLIAYNFVRYSLRQRRQHGLCRSGRRDGNEGGRHVCVHCSDRHYLHGRSQTFGCCSSFGLRMERPDNRYNKRRRKRQLRSGKRQDEGERSESGGRICSPRSNRC